MPKNDRQDRIDRIFIEACGLPPDERGRFLDRACDADEGIRSEVERLLAADAELEQNENALPKPPLNQLLRDLHDAVPGISNTELKETKSFALECEQCGAQLEQGPGAATAECPKCGGVTQTGAIFEIQGELSTEQLPSRFRVNRIIGEGSFGIVVQATDSLLDRNVAIKIPKSKLVSKKLFVREAKIASKLRHENIVTIHDVNDSETFAFIVSDFIEGTSLNRWRRQRKLSTREACQLCITLAEAMEIAHQQGVVHRDLKPSNIVMDAQGQPHILDFGLSKSRTPSEGSLAKAGTPIGTPGFMPPEQVHGDSEHIDAKSDVYSLGVILYQMLTGMLPFSGEDIYESICNDPPRPIQTLNKKLPLALNAIVMKALNKNPEDRYQTAGALAGDLQRFLDGKKVAAYPKVDSRVAATAVRRWALVATAIVLTSLLAVAIYFGWQQYWQNNPYKRVFLDASSPNTVLHWHRFDEKTGLILSVEPTTKAAGSIVHLKPGFYLIEASTEGKKHRFFRTVPDENDEPKSILGLALKHRIWKEDGSLIRLPEIEITTNYDIRDFVSSNGGTVMIDESSKVSPFLRNLQFRVEPFWITKNELAIQDVKELFPEVNAPAISFDIALAYAERMGACIPSIEHYIILERHGIGLNNLTTGLKEWTATPMPRIITSLGKDKHEIAADLGMRLVLKSTTSADSKFSSFQSITAPTAIAPIASHRFENESGFRLILPKD